MTDWAEYFQDKDGKGVSQVYAMKTKQFEDIGEVTKLTKTGKAWRAVIVTVDGNNASRAIKPELAARLQEELDIEVEELAPKPPKKTAKKKGDDDDDSDAKPAKGARKAAKPKADGPKRPMSSYMRWGKEEGRALALQNLGDKAKPTDVTKEMGRIWREEVSEETKAQYKEEYDAEKAAGGGAPAAPAARKTVPVECCNDVDEECVKADTAKRGAARKAAAPKAKKATPKKAAARRS